MMIRAVVLLPLAVACLSGQHRDASDRALALMLAKADSQPRTISEIVTSRESIIPLLLSWTRNPPGELNPLEVNQLNIGMAEVFGRLKTKEAIPFLIKNISLDRSPITNVWTRGPDIILGRLPAVAALIQIGPIASTAIIRTPQSDMSLYDRLAAVFVVSRIKGVPEAREYLVSALGEANMLRDRTEEGLRFLESHH